MSNDDCIEEGRTDVPCQGDVEWRSVNGTGAWPRCDTHWNMRLERYSNSIERYADSDVSPRWFDPAHAGERWNEDDY